MPYGELGINCEPSPDDIRRAIHEGRLDARRFQIDEAALHAEWRAASQGGQDHEALRRSVTDYHAGRIAFFVAHGWSDHQYPITVDANNVLHDGGHRLRAARFAGAEEIEVKVAP